MAKSESVLRILSSLESQMPTDRPRPTSRRPSRVAVEGGQFDQNSELDEDFLVAAGESPEPTPIPEEEGTADPIQGSGMRPPRRPGGMI